MKRVVFRKTKRNLYSIVSLIAAVTSRNLDVRFHLVKSLDEILSYPKDVIVAYSLMSFDIEWAKDEISVLKNKGYTVIAGGPHPTALPDELLNYGVDYVFLGDGEENFIRFLKGEHPSNKIHDGVKNRVDLNEYPPFDVKSGAFMPVELMRGCPFRCGYCFTPYLGGGNPRYREIDFVVHYARLGVKIGKKLSRFIAPNSFAYMSKNGVTPNLDAIDELLFKLKKVGIEEIYFGTFPSEVRPESVNAEVLKVIKKYVNNRSIVIGAQSGSDRVLKIINRGHDVETVERAVEVITYEGFVPHVDFIFGFPFETDEDIHKTFEFIEKIVKKYRAKIHAHTFMPLPKTPLAKFGPGKLKKIHYKLLGKLSSMGIVDGYWHKQQDLALSLAKYSQE